MSLRDQLLKSGLANKKQVAAANRSLRKKRKKSQILHFLSFLRRCNSSNIQYFALKIELLVVLHHISLKTKAQVSIKILEKVILR